MQIAEFYRYQTQARGTRTVADVEALAWMKTRLYDLTVLPWLPENKSGAVYEAACGSGVLLHWLRGRGFQNLKGSDFSSVQIDLAKAAGFDVTIADSIQELRALPASSLDCIIALDFYEHLTKEDFLDFLYACHHALRSSGRLILRGPNGDSPVLGRALYNDITHVTTYTAMAFTVLLEMAGFEKAQFKDDTLASIVKHRWLIIPFSWLAQKFLRLLIRFATREDIECLSSSFFIFAQKP